MKKNKNKDVAKEKQPHLSPSWNKESYLNKKLNDRPLEFYIRNYRFNLSIALVLSICSFLVLITVGMIIDRQEESEDYYITSTDGKVLELELSQEDINKMRKAFNELRQQQ